MTVFHSFTILPLIAAFAVGRKYVVYVGTSKGKPQTLNIVQHTCDFVNQVLSQTFRDSYIEPATSDISTAQSLLMNS